MFFLNYCSDLLLCSFAIAMKTPPDSALLLVDGYNIIGHWPSLQQTRDQFGLELARQELIETLINYSTYQGFKTQVVFDAQLQKQPAQEEVISGHLTVHYTDWSQTADTYIEKRCAHFSRQSSPPPARLIVATSDRAQQLTILGYGAEWMSAQYLAQDVLQSRLKVSSPRPKRSQARPPSLSQRLDPRVQERLNLWRLGMDA
jgi:hypothetical protein